MWIPWIPGYGAPPLRRGPREAERRSQAGKIVRKGRFDRPLTASLKTRFDRFGILRRWDFQNPGQCVFDLEPVAELATSLPKTIEDKIKADIYDATLTPDNGKSWKDWQDDHEFGDTLSGNIRVTIKDVADPTHVPEPSAMALLGTGLAGLGLTRRRRNNQA